MTDSSLRKATLDNGLQVLLKESHVAPVATFWIFYRVGSRNELPGATGASHFVEHMLFKGTEQFPRGEFDKAVARAGGVFNGMTSQDVTMYFETFPSDRVELALQVESDRMANSSFDAAEVESERTVILSEREGAENSPFWLLTEEVQAAAYRVHSYHHPIIGWRGDLVAVQRDDLLRHYRTYYTPNNAVAVAVGDFAAGAMLEQIGRYFGSLPSGPAAPPVRLQEPEQNAERRVILRGPDQTAYLLQAFHAPPATHTDFFPLTVMDAVLGGAKSMGLASGGNNRSNRLYKALVEQELAVGAGCGYQPAMDPTLFSFEATLAPGVEHRQVEDAIWVEIARIQQDGVTAAELQKAIKQTKAQFVYSRESVTYQGYWLGFSQVVASTDWLDAWVDQLSAVTSEDVQRVAATHFAEPKQTVGWYVPAPADAGAVEEVDL